MKPVPRRRFVQISLALAGALPLSACGLLVVGGTAATTAVVATDRRTAGEQVDDQTIELRVASEMNRSEEHTSELQSLMRISYAVFCLQNKQSIIKTPHQDST